jgi:CDP-diacylglycerol--serine O-phosphatidyltransferase
VTASALSDATGKVKYYEGTPIPTSLAIVGLLWIAWLLGHVGDDIWLGGVKIGPAWFHPLVLVYAVSGTLMVSASLRIPKL